MKMDTKDLSGFQPTALDNSQRFFVRVATSLAIVLVVKMASVWFYGAQPIQRAWPYNAFLFQPQDRFTDYLIPYAGAGFHNIYSPADWAAAQLTQPAYGYFQFAILRYLPFRSSLVVTFGSFLIVLVSLIAIIWLIYVHNYQFLKPYRLLYFVIFVIASYPLAFEVDRGNCDVFGGLIIAALYALVLSKGVMSAPSAILIAMLISLKPSFALFIIPLVLCIRWLWVLLAGVLVFINYAVPVVFYGAKPNYMVNLIEINSKILNGASLFTHNLGGGLLAMGIHTGMIFNIALGMCLLFPVVWVRYRIRELDKRVIFLTMLNLTVLATLIVNPYSPDYRLIFLLPAFMALPSLLPNLLSSAAGSRLLVINFVLAFGYTNIAIPGVFDYFTTLRAFSLIVIFFLVLWEAEETRWISRGVFTSRDSQSGSPGTRLVE
jgi:hypothetical protein